MILDTIKHWIAGVLSKMIPQSTVKDALGVELAVNTKMTEALNTWSLMYTNEATWLNDYVHSMNLAAAIAGEIARSVTLELKLEVTGGTRAKFLMEQLNPYIPKLRYAVEYGAAKGGLILKPWVSGKRVLVDFVQADQFFPVTFDSSGNITDCVFSEQKQIGKKYYTRLEFHSMTDKGCVIKNKAYVSESKDNLGRETELSSVPDWVDIEPEATIENVTKPLFSYFRYPMANTIDSASPLGVSCYSRAVDLIKQADLIWSNLLWEFESGQRALYIDVLAFGKDEDGKAILPNKRLYKTIESGSPEGEFFQEWSPDIREKEILEGLEATLKKIEFVTGLAYGTLSDPNTIEKTATEILTSKQRSYATITETQKALQTALEGLLEAMDIWVTMAGIAPKGSYKIDFQFDDSVVVDKDAQMASDLMLVTAGIMSKEEFRMRNFGEDEATAKQKLATVKEEQPENPEENENFGGGS